MPRRDVPCGSCPASEVSNLQTYPGCTLPGMHWLRVVRSETPTLTNDGTVCIRQSGQVSMLWGGVKDIPGFGFASGGYPPFICSFPIHCLAASMASDEAERLRLSVVHHMHDLLTHL